MLTEEGLLEAVANRRLNRYLGEAVAESGGVLTKCGGNDVLQRVSRAAMVAREIPAEQWSPGITGRQAPRALDGVPTGGDPTSNRFQDVNPPSVESPADGRWVLAFYGGGDTYNYSFSPNGQGRGFRLTSRLLYPDGVEGPVDLGAGVAATVLRYRSPDWVLDCDGHQQWGLVAPGVVYSSLSQHGIRDLIDVAGIAGAKLVKASLNTAINAATRSGRDGVVAAFKGGNSPFQITVLERDRQLAYSELQTQVTVDRRQATATVERSTERLRGLQSYKPLEESLQAAIDAGDLAEYRLTPSNVWLKLTPQRIRVDAVTFEGATYEAGTYELPPAIIKVPQVFRRGDFHDAVKVFREDGRRYPHPHIMGGANPCWGETQDAQVQNKAIACDLWVTDPAEFVYWWRAMLGSYYDEGGTSQRYEPFQTWATRVDDAA